MNLPLGIHIISLTVDDGKGGTAADTVQITVQDTQPPLIHCDSPDGAWHPADAVIACTAADEVSGLANAADASFHLSTNVAAGTETADASTNSRLVCDAAGNCASTGPIPGNKVDKRAPDVHCGSADGMWHASDVSIACVAMDGGSGFADLADAAFSLNTSVPAGTETPNASTNSRLVCDAVGNCTAAGPIAGNKVDMKAPEITINAPAGTYLLNQDAAASYSCNDGGSGLASCNGPVASGSNFDTAAVGTKSFIVNAADEVGNTASRTVSYAVTYNICLLYDPTKAKKRGSTFPVKLQPCKASGVNMSSSGLVVAATRVARISDDAPAPLEDSGSANPDSNFRFDPTLGGTGGYIFNLSSSGFASGTYRLFFKVSGDPMEHSVNFQVK